MFWSLCPYWQLPNCSKLRESCFDLNFLTDNWLIVPNFNWKNHVLISISLPTTDRWENHLLISMSLPTTGRWFQNSTEKVMFWCQCPYWQLTDCSKFELKKSWFDLNVLTDNWQIIPNFSWQNLVLISMSLLTTDRLFVILTEKIMFWSRHPYQLRIRL